MNSGRSALNTGVHITGCLRTIYRAAASLAMCCGNMHIYMCLDRAPTLLKCKCLELVSDQLSSTKKQAHMEEAPMVGSTFVELPTLGVERSICPKGLESAGAGPPCTPLPRSYSPVHTTTILTQQKAREQEKVKSVTNLLTVNNGPTKQADFIRPPIGGGPLVMVGIGCRGSIGPDC